MATSGVTYNSTKEKIYYIGIPIPNKKEAKWGLANKHFVHTPLLDKDIYFLIKQDITLFDNLGSYFVNSMYKTMDSIIKQNNISLKRKKT